jgi:DNA-binding MarR family transcriptional regulator
VKKTEDDPFVKSLHFITKDYFGAVSHLLAGSSLDRNYYTLLLICRSEAGLTQKELSCALEIDKVTMSRKIDHLVNLGFITRESNPEDRRTVVLKATPQALTLSKTIGHAYAALNKAAFEGIPAEERKAFLATAEKLRDNVANLPKAAVKLEYKQKNAKR